MKLIETKTLASAAASIEFTSIPQDGTDLFVFISARTTRAQISDAIRVAFNTSTSNFSSRYLYGFGTNPVISGTETNYVGQVSAASSTSNGFGSLALYIPNYTSSVAKSYSSDAVSTNNGADPVAVITAGLWNPSTQAAITGLTFSGANGDLVAGTLISLYKITKGSDGTTVVS